MKKCEQIIFILLKDKDYQVKLQMKSVLLNVQITSGTRRYRKTERIGNDIQKTYISEEKDGVAGY